MISVPIHPACPYPPHLTVTKKTKSCSGSDFVGPFQWSSGFNIQIFPHKANANQRVKSSECPKSNNNLQNRYTATENVWFWHNPAQFSSSCWVLCLWRTNFLLKRAIQPIVYKPTTLRGSHASCTHYLARKPLKSKAIPTNKLTNQPKDWSADRPTDQPTDRPTNWQTNRVTYRVPCRWL